MAAVMPDGWLKDPHSRNVLHFQRDPKDTFWCQQVIVDKGEPIPGQPALLKTRMKLDRKRAVRKWFELQREGWTSVGPQW
jgi:hypothetical protein